MVVGKALGEELERTKIVVVPKLKTEVAELTSSLKAVLEAAKACREKMRQDQVVNERTQEALKAEVARIEVEKVELVREKAEVEKKKKALSLRWRNVNPSCCI